MKASKRAAWTLALVALVAAAVPGSVSAVPSGIPLTRAADLLVDGATEQVFISSHWDDKIVVVDLDGNFLKEFPLTGAAGMTLHAGDVYAALWGGSEVVRISTQTLEVTRHYPLAEESRDVTWLNGKLWLSCIDDDLRSLDPVTGVETTHDVEQQVSCDSVESHPTHPNLLYTSNTSGTKVFDVSTAPPTRVRSISFLHPATPRPGDGSFLAGNTLMSTSTPRPVRNFGFPPPWGPVAPVAFSEDGEKVAVAFGETIELYDASNGQRLGWNEFRSCVGHWDTNAEAPVVGVEFAPDGEEVIVLTEESLDLNDASQVAFQRMPISPEKSRLTLTPRREEAVFHEQVVYDVHLARGSESSNRKIVTSDGVEVELDPSGNGTFSRKMTRTGTFRLYAGWQGDERFACEVAEATVLVRPLVAGKLQNAETMRGRYAVFGSGEVPRYKATYRPMDTFNGPDFRVLVERKEAEGWVPIAETGEQSGHFGGSYPLGSVLLREPGVRYRVRARAVERGAPLYPGASSPPSYYRVVE